MFWFFLAYIALCLYRAKPGLKTLDPDYMSVPRTQSVKGVFILLVFFSHYNSYVEYAGTPDNVYVWIVRTFGQCMVAPFLFISGYGIMESIRRKGEGYVAAIPKNRVLKTLLPFVIAVLLFGLVQTLLGVRFSPRVWLLSLIGWESLGNSNWYIFIALLLYLLTYVSFRLLRNARRQELPALLTAVLTALCVYVMAHFGLKAYYWYDTALCYCCGMFFSLWRDRIERIINRSTAMYLLTLAALLAATALTKHLSSNDYADILCMLLFAALVTVVTMRFAIGNAILEWAGAHLFQIYILQRLPMLVLDRFGLLDAHPALCFPVCLAVTLLLAVPFERLCDRLWALVSPPAA